MSNNASGPTATYENTLITIAAKYLHLLQVLTITSFNVQHLKEQYWLHTIQWPIQLARILNDITQDPAATYQTYDHCHD